MLAYIHTHLHPQIHTCIRTYVCTYVRTCIPIYILAYIHACMHPQVLTYTMLTPQIIILVGSQSGACVIAGLASVPNASKH